MVELTLAGLRDETIVDFGMDSYLDLDPGLIFPLF